MPTPIRIRGKRKASTASPAKPERPRRRRKPEMQPMKYKPHLESLPVEILHHIFCYGTNLQLPLVCSSLYNALTSQSVKVRLVLQLFSAEDTIDTSPASAWNYHRFLGPFQKDSMWLKYCVEKDPDIAKAQSAVLRQKWFTYEFLRECQRNHLTRAGHRELHEFFSGEFKLVLDTQLRQFDDGVRSNLDWGSYSQKFVHPIKPYGNILWEQTEQMQKPQPFTPFYRFQRDDGESIAIFLPDTFGLNSQLGILREGPSVATPLAKRYTFPALQPTCRIPSKLQHGPWTQQKGYLLTQLIFGISGAGGVAELMPPTRSDADAATDGLSDALREQCVPWLRLYLANTGHHKHWGILSVIQLGETDLSDCMLPENHNSTDFSIEPPSPQLRLDTTGPWRAINDPDLGYIPNCEFEDVRMKHFDVILHEAPVGGISHGLFSFLFQESDLTEEQCREIYLMVIRANVYVEDPARLEMIHKIEQDVSRYLSRPETFV